MKYNGGDSGIKISVLYWRRSLIRVSVIRGSSVFSAEGCSVMEVHRRLRRVFAEDALDVNLDAGPIVLKALERTFLIRPAARQQRFIRRLTRRWKKVLLGKETLWKNNLNFVKDVSMVYLNFFIKQL